MLYSTTLEKRGETSQRGHLGVAVRTFLSFRSPWCHCEDTLIFVKHLICLKHDVLCLIATLESIIIRELGLAKFPSCYVTSPWASLICINKRIASRTVQEYDREVSTWGCLTHCTPCLQVKLKTRVCCLISLSCGLNEQWWFSIGKTHQRL